MDARQTVESGHNGEVFDLSADATGRFLASASSDMTVKVWVIEEASPIKEVACLRAHEAPVLRVAWAPARFAGSGLLSIGSDNQVILWKDTSSSHSWQKVYSRSFSSPVYCVTWAPQEYNEMFACACGDGKVYIFVLQDQGQWEVTSFEAHKEGCCGISWSPCLPPGGLVSMPISSHQSQQPQLVLPAPRLVTCGRDRFVKVFRFAAQDRQWIQEHELCELQSHLVRYVSWAPNVGIPFTYIAAGSDEGNVVIWSQDGVDGKWMATTLPRFDDSICRLSWSSVGTFLLVSTASNSVTMWKETLDGSWKLATSLCAQAQN